MNPLEPKTGDEVTVRFRTARENAEHVYLWVNGEKKEMRIASKTERFDFYESSFLMGTEIADYYFEIHSGGICCYFNKKGPARDLEPFFNYKVTPGFSTPDWAKGAVFYQIYVDRFANGDPSNDVLNREYIYIKEPSKKIDDWYCYPEQMDVRNFYGGDLQGVLDHLDYLKELGVDVIYLNPIFVSPSNHKYDIQDYDYIDPHYGKIVVDDGNTLPDWENNNMNASKYISRVTDKRNLEASNEFFVHFVEEVHKKGMRVILDGVFNHCGWHFPAFEDVVQKGEASGKKDWFYGLQFPVIRPEDPEEYPNYECFGYERMMPKLDTANPEVADFICKVGRYWVEEFHTDGWRLDVASEINDALWRRFYREVKEVNPEAILIGEVWETANHWLDGTIFDSTMNYDFRKHCKRFFGEESISSAAFDSRVTNMRMRYREQTVFAQLNLLDSHDVSRFYSLCNENEW